MADKTRARAIPSAAIKGFDVMRLDAANTVPASNPARKPADT